MIKNLYLNLRANFFFKFFFQKIEQGLDKGGLNGKHCVLRSVCELSETPIHHWTVVGEMITNLIK